MKSIVAGAFLALVSTAAVAQSAGVGVLDQGGRNVYQFRSADDRATRFVQAQDQELRRRGIVPGSPGSGSGGNGSGLASATAINNYFQVTQTNNCSATGGSSVTCSGGTQDIRDVTQTTTGSSNSADNVLTGNTVRNTTRTVNNNGGE